MSEKEYCIEIYPKGNDLRGKEVREEIIDLGVENIREVLVSRVYLLEGKLEGDSGEVVGKIARELLADPVVEDFSLGERLGHDIRITVFFKPGVLDVEGNRVVEALKIMKIKGIVNVRTGRKYIINSTDGMLSTDTCRFFSEKLLYNKVIEKLEIDFGKNRNN